MSSTSSCYCPGPCCETTCNCEALGPDYYDPNSLCPPYTEDLGIQIVGGETADGTICEGVSCRLCVGGSGSLWRIVNHYGSPSPNSACTSQPNISALYGCRTYSSTDPSFLSSIQGTITVNCQNEASGYCRNSGAEGVYNIPDGFIAGPVQYFGGDPGPVQARAVFYFEDCGIGEYDYTYTVELESCV